MAIIFNRSGGKCYSRLPTSVSISHNMTKHIGYIAVRGSLGKHKQ